MSKFVHLASFEYLCYGSMAIINVLLTGQIKKMRIDMDVSHVIKI